MPPFAGNGNPPYATNRASSIGNVLLNMGGDWDNDSDDEAVRRPARGPEMVVVKKPSPRRRSRSAPQHPGHRQQVPLPRYPQGGPSSSPPRQPIPPRAHTTPIAALYSRNGPPPLPPLPPVGYHRPTAPPQPRPQPRPQPQAEQRPTYMRSPLASPAPAPHPRHLQDLTIPIRPAFFRPSSTLSSTTLQSGISCSSPILRGNSEGTLLPSRGEKGDDFWRRFSIVAKEPESMDQSSWLQKSQSRSNRMTRFLWLLGVLLIILILGGIGVGIWMTRDNPGHQQPTAIGGSGDHSMGAPAPAAATGPTIPGVATDASLIRHVSPTNTVERRRQLVPLPTLVYKP